MNDSEIRTLEKVKKVLKAVRKLKFKGLSRQKKYTWLDDIIRRFGYHSLPKKDKGLLRRYMMTTTGFSRPQLNRLLGRNLALGAIESFAGRRNKFANTYTRACPLLQW